MGTALGLSQQANPWNYQKDLITRPAKDRSTHAVRSERFVFIPPVVPIRAMVSKKTQAINKTIFFLPDECENFVIALDCSKRNAVRSHDSDVVERVLKTLQRSMRLPAFRVLTIWRRKIQ